MRLPLTTIHLHNLRFYGTHGVHEQESLTGNEFEVSLDLDFQAPAEGFVNLGATINYEIIFQIVRQRMLIRTALLETIAWEIINEIHEGFPFVERIKISIFKLQAAIPYLNGKVGVSLEKNFNV